MSDAGTTPDVEPGGPHKAFAVVFGIVGGMALSKFLDPSSYVIGSGTIAAGVLGITWVAFAILRSRWDAGKRDESNARLLLIVACAAAVTSAGTAIFALLFAIGHGFTIEMPAVSPSSRPIRGAWMIWLFPTLAFLLTLISFFVAKGDIQMVRQHLSHMNRVEGV